MKKVLLKEKIVTLLANANNIKGFSKEHDITHAYAYDVIKKLEKAKLLSITKNNNRLTTTLTDKGLEIKELFEKLLEVL